MFSQIINLDALNYVYDYSYGLTLPFKSSLFSDLPNYNHCNAIYAVQIIL